MAEKLTLPNLGAVLVGDGRKAVLYVNHGDAGLPDLRVETVIEAPENPRTSDQGTDRPGRAWAGSARSAMDETDWHAKAETAFAARVAAELDRRNKADPFKALVIAVPPRFLGDLRKHLSQAVKDHVTAEIAKELTHGTATDIEQLFAQH